MTEVTTQTPDRHEVRSQRTLTKLLDAAEEVFVRDGYEAAQLDEIVARAGRSKGAVYLHFKSKEDLFLALIEDRIKSYIGHYREHMNKCTTVEQRLAAFREFYAGLVRDRDYHVLTIEFKLFALRHPNWKERYRQTFDALKRPNDELTYRQMFGKYPRAERVDLEASLIALGPIANALVVESSFEADTLSERVLRNILNRVFDALLQRS